MVDYDIYIPNVLPDKNENNDDKAWLELTRIYNEQ